MALYVVAKRILNGVEVGEKTLLWYVGGKSLKDHVEQQFSNPQIIEIQADGNELEAIELQFKNIPFHERARIQTWRGDFALFIFDHLL